MAVSQVHRTVVTPEQAEMWFQKSGMTVEIAEADRLTDLVLEGILPPSPPIIIQDGRPVLQRDVNRLAAIMSVMFIKGFPPIEMDVEFTTALPDVKEAVNE
jgi:hypothetical protein